MWAAIPNPTLVCSVTKYDLESFSQLPHKGNLDSIFEIFEKSNPCPRIELEYVNKFTLLVAIVLSAQSTDVGVNKATKALFAKFSTPREFLNLGLEGIRSYVKSIGLYNTKAKNIIALSEIICSKYDGQVPEDIENLVRLPGVGRKSANVFLNTALGANCIGVDTHVFRVAKRIGISSGKNVIEVEKDLVERIPVKWLNRASHWLVLHGRYICKARKPLCGSCGIREYCEYYGKNL